MKGVIWETLQFGSADSAVPVVNPHYNLELEGGRTLGNYASQRWKLLLVTFRIGHTVLSLTEVKQ